METPPRVQEGQQPSDLREKARRLEEIRRKIGCITIIDLDDPTHLKMIDEAWMHLIPAICDALLSGGPRSPEGPIWLDIASAPKDGTQVVLYAAPAIARHDGGCEVAYWATPLGWVSNYGGVLHFDPTHWARLQLPAPPGDPSEGRETTTEDRARVDSLS